MADEKNALVEQNPRQVDTYHARGGDFPVKKVRAINGAGGETGEASGQDALVSQSGTQESPRNNESDDNEPTEWQSGGRSKIVAKAFPVQTNKGESSDSATSPAMPESIDLATGKIVSKGYSATKISEVADKLVRLGR
jgi:hypothetical protein